MPINTKKAFRDFTNRLKILIQKRPDLITVTLSNIFTMRLIGNKTHGDLAEIGIMEFVNQFMYDFRSAHVGMPLMGLLGANMFPHALGKAIILE